LQIHHELITLAKVFAAAFDVGLDVLAVSIGAGVARLAFDASVCLGLAFAGSEIVMQMVGYGLGTGAGRLLGAIATYVVFALLALIGSLMIRDSYRHQSETGFDATHGAGLLLTWMSISLDSLGVGVALPSAAIPLLTLLIKISITTTIFTFIGLAFGSRLGERYERNAERAAGIILIALAGFFVFQQLIRSLPTSPFSSLVLPNRCSKL
jgi:putative Mn2+ efflux pump MntP